MGFGVVGVNRVCKTDKVPSTEKYTNVYETYWCFAWKRSLHRKCFSSAAWLHLFRIDF